jgi:hypothetical protein
MKARALRRTPATLDRVRWLARAVLLGLAVALAPAAIGAEGIYRCTGADGKTVFTSNPSACPNAKPHVLKSKLQTVIESPGSASSSRGARASRPAARAPARADGLEQMWRRKRSEKQQQLAQLDRSLHRAKSMAKGCNRGGEWYSTDESGIRKHVSCDKVKARLRRLEMERAELQEYLRSGIEDECRKADCLPGWIR